jgi:hypothetical protein
VPGNGTIVGELVGLGGVEVEVPFPVTLRFRQICFTRVPKAVSRISLWSPSWGKGGHTF